MNYLPGKWKSQTKKNPQATDDQLLVALKEQWDDHKMTMTMIRDILMYMESVILSYRGGFISCTASITSPVSVNRLRADNLKYQTTRST